MFSYSILNVPTYTNKHRGINVIEEWEFTNKGISTTMFADCIPVNSHDVETDKKCIRGKVIFNGQENKDFEDHEVFYHSTPIQSEGTEVVNHE